jgi:effector-binding domain-containing protein
MKNWKLICVVLLAAFGLVACSGANKEVTPTTDQSTAAAPSETTGAPSEATTAEPAAAPAASPAMALLDLAIQARGGLEKIKTVTSWTAKSKGTYLGMPYEAASTYDLESSRMDIANPKGAPMTMVFGTQTCWSKTGPVVIPCSDKEKETYSSSTLMHQALLLFPLKESGWEISDSKETVDDVAYDVLTVKKETPAFTGKLYLDPTTHLVSRVSHESSLGAQAGTYLTVISNHKEECGVMMPTNVSTTFAGAPYVTEESTEISCQAADASVFAQPEQVKDMMVEEKASTQTLLFCTKMKGPYTGMGEAMGKLMGLLSQNQLAPAGAPVSIYVKAPPAVKKPKDFVTEICFPVAAAPKAKMPKELIKKDLPSTNVLTVYGIGDYATKSGDLAKMLIDEVKKRKLKVAGPMRQVSYMDPSQHPTDQLVSEMQIPIKATGKAAAKGTKKPAK